MVDLDKAIDMNDVCIILYSCQNGLSVNQGCK